MNDDVLEKILRFRYEGSVETDVAGSVVAVPPFGLHALEEISADFDTEFRLPFRDDRGNCPVE